MVDLIIVCENSFGMDVRMIAEAMLEYMDKNKQDRWFRVAGYICPEGTVLKQKNDPLPILGSLETWMPMENQQFAMGIVDPDRKEKAVCLLKSRGAKFATLWAPWVLAPLTMRFSEGCIIAAHSIMANAKIGPFVTLFHSMVANAVVSEYCSVMAYANITNATLGRKCFVDNNAAIMTDITVGDSACVGPNSVVVKNVKAGMKVSGIPAKRVKNQEEIK